MSEIRLKFIPALLILISSSMVWMASAEDRNSLTMERNGARAVFTVDRQPEERYLRIFGFNPGIFSKYPNTVPGFFPFGLIFSSMKEANEIWTSYNCETKAMAISRFEFVLPADQKVEQVLTHAAKEQATQDQVRRFCLRAKVGRITLKEFYPPGSDTNSAGNWTLKDFNKFPTSFPVVMYITEAESVDCALTIPTS